jgi:hypothetical protein
MYGSIDYYTSDIITNFAFGVGGSSWWAVNNEYSGIGYLPIRYIVTDTTYSFGPLLTFQTTWDYIASLINRGYLPADYYGIYMLVTSR